MNSTDTLPQADRSRSDSDAKAPAWGLGDNAHRAYEQTATAGSTSRVISNPISAIIR